MEELKNLIFSLSESAGIAGQSGALAIAESAINSIENFNKLAKITKPSVDFLGSLAFEIDGGLPYTLLLDAHIDEIGFVVTDITEHGFLRVAPCGGIDRRTLPGAEVVVYGTRPLPGIFCATPPHLSNSEEKLPEISEMAIDIGYSFSESNKLVHPGDRVNYKMNPQNLTTGYLTGKSLDNRAGAAALIEAARMLLSSDLLFGKIIILLSGQEELGCQGAKIASYISGAEEAISVDVSYGTAFCAPKSETGKLGGGTMIGLAPTLDKIVSEGLIRAAESAGIPYQLEGMGGKTSTNADVISTTKSGIPCGLLSIPLRYMHSPVEIIHIDDVESTARTIFEYIITKGTANHA